MKKSPGCLGLIVDYTTELCGNFFINHEIRIPIKRPVFHGTYPIAGFSLNVARISPPHRQAGNFCSFRFDPT